MTPEKFGEFLASRDFTDAHWAEFVKYYLANNEFVTEKVNTIAAELFPLEDNFPDEAFNEGEDPAADYPDEEHYTFIEEEAAYDKTYPDEVEPEEPDPDYSKEEMYGQEGWLAERYGANSKGEQYPEVYNSMSRTGIGDGKEFLNS